LQTRCKEGRKNCDRFRRPKRGLRDERTVVAGAAQSHFLSGVAKRATIVGKNYGRLHGEPMHEKHTEMQELENIGFT
jgi:hypothetical protein